MHCSSWLVALMITISRLGFLHGPLGKSFATQMLYLSFNAPVALIHSVIFSFCCDLAMQYARTTTRTQTRMFCGEKKNVRDFVAFLVSSPRLESVKIDYTFGIMLKGLHNRFLQRCCAVNFT